MAETQAARLRLLTLLGSEEQRAGAQTAAGWLDTMAETRSLPFLARVACRVAGRLLRRELAGAQQQRPPGRPHPGGLVEVVSMPPQVVPYPVDAEHPPADFDG